MSRRKRFASWIQSLPEAWFMIWSVVTWLFAYSLVFALYRIGFVVGFWKSPGHFRGEDAFTAILTGIFAGGWELLDRHRKRETAKMNAAGQDRTMI